jgi:cobalt-zinc-cadmium efflux system membrane fusion protein
VPGTIVASADRIARVPVRLPGTVAELRKRPGDMVAKDEILAVFESRELAEAKSEYLAARLTDELQQDLFGRDKILWEQRLSSEQQFIRARNLALQTKMRLDTTRQKLLALGLQAGEIESIPRLPEALLRRLEVRSPMAGRIVERKVDTGAVVGRDSLETELFVIVDLTRVWVELALSPADLPVIKEGQSVEITARGITNKATGQVIFINPLLDKASRSARVMVEIANEGDMWRPGTFVTAAITVDEHAVPLAVPVGAVQSIGAEKIVFVRNAEGFVKRPVVTGRTDDRRIEIVSGLQQGERVAATNTFLLKAELLKSQSED